VSKQILFTDLDGTLLDLDTYSFEASAPAVAKLQNEGIPVIFCSSKTKAEQEQLRSQLSVKDPFISENGSAIFIPTGYFKTVEITHERIGDYLVIKLGQSDDLILSTIAEYRSKFPFSYWGYQDLTLSEICEITGLNELAAQKAMDRDFSETLIKGNFDAIEFHHFKLAMELRGIGCVQGSKFVTIMGKYADKGRAVKLLQQLYATNWGNEVTSIGIGDSNNDLPMLEAVDRPFLVKKPSGKWHSTDLPQVTHIDGVGAKGWYKVVEEHLISTATAKL
jgi:mannosyl-3-phosphoglycerate phosphatase